jgi:competence protein ComEC
MKTLKIILHYNFFYYFVLALTIIYSYFFFVNDSVLVNEEKELEGVIIEKFDDKKYIILSDQKILVYFKEEVEYELGDYLKLNGLYDLPKTNTNFNLFDYRLYLRTKQIKYIFYEKSHELTSKIHRIDYFIKNKVNDRVGRLNSPYIKSFILGKSDELSDSYQNLQITHLFALSGFHIGIIILLLDKRINTLLLVFILLIYLFITGFAISFSRAYLLYIAIKINDYFRLNTKKENILILLMCSFVLYNPYVIFSISFQLSFINVYFLIKYSNFFKRFDNYFIKGFFISLVASLVSFPIITYHFYQYNFLSIFLTAILSLPIALIYIVSLIAFILNDINFLNILVYYFEKIIILFDSINTNIILGRPNLFFIFLYYLTNLYILHQFLFKRYYLLCLFSFLIIANIIFNNYSNNLKVYMIDVGQGDSIFVHHNNSKILIDTGGVFNNDKYSYYNVIPFLKSIGITNIDYLIITHGDYDHMGEAINLVENFKVKNVIFNCGLYNELEQALIKVLEEKNIKYYSCIKELNIEKYKLRFLNTKEYDNENDNSSVIYLNYNNHKFLFMGDAGVEKEKDILEKYNLNDIDFLKVGHHGANTSSSEIFINSLNLKYSLISVGKNNRYGHPKDSVLDTLSNSKIYLTSLDGSVEIKLNKNGYKIRTCLP